MAATAILFTSSVDEEVINLENLLITSELELQEVEFPRETVLRHCQEALAVADEVGQDEAADHIKDFAAQFPHFGSEEEIWEKCWFFTKGHEQSTLDSLDRNAEKLREFLDENPSGMIGSD